MRGRSTIGEARPFGARAGTAPGWGGLGALAVRSLAVKRGEVGRLRVRELAVEQEHEQEV